MGRDSTQIWKYASDENEGLEWDGVTEVMNYKEQEARDRERKEAWEREKKFFL